MELREYLRVILRYRWLIAALVVVVGVGSWIFRAPPAPQYSASVRFTIGVNAPPADKVTGYDPILTAFQASEYIRDDFVQVVQSDLFADDINAQLAKMGETGIKIGKGNIGGAVEKQRRLMSMSITWNSAKEAQKIADAAVKNLSENNAKYFAQLGASGASLTVIDKPTVSPVQPSLRERLDIPIRIALAFFAGIALAFLLDYLDNSVRDARDVESLGLRVVGEIPRGK
jgi:capsular polysaccharide biosynthesis protein